MDLVVFNDINQTVLLRTDAICLSVILNIYIIYKHIKRRRTDTKFHTHVSTSYQLIVKPFM